MATKAKTPAKPWTKNGKAKAGKAGMTVMSGREATAAAAAKDAAARRKASREARNAAPTIMPAPAGHPAAKQAPLHPTDAEMRRGRRQAQHEEARADAHEAGTKAPAKQAPAKAPAKEKAPKALSARAQVAADAEAGKLPSPPNWEKRTHYKAQHAALVELATKGDLKGLQGFEMPGAMTQLNRYRDLCIIALKAKGAQPARIAPARRRAR